jgi:hypothetical protein
LERGLFSGPGSEFAKTPKLKEPLCPPEHHSRREGKGGEFDKRRDRALLMVAVVMARPSPERKGTRSCHDLEPS